MEYNKLLELIKTVSESNISNFKYEEGNLKIAMSTELGEDGGFKTISNADKKDSCEETVVKTVANEVKTDSIFTEEKKVEDSIVNIKVPKDAANTVNSPLVGTFYTSPTENGEPFVKIGDTVKKGQTVAIVEAMKLMNEIESEYDGVISEVYVTNGQSVEYGQPLFAIA